MISREDEREVTKTKMLFIVLIILLVGGLTLAFAAKHYGYEPIDKYNEAITLDVYCQGRCGELDHLIIEDTPFGYSVICQFEDKSILLCGEGR